MTDDRPVEYGSYPSLRDRVVVVTGGASGIGEKIVEQFAQQGAQVAFLDIQKEAGMKLVNKISANAGTEPHFLPCDLTDIDALRDGVRRIIARFKTVDVLVNNAGHDARHSVESVTPESWDQSMAVNLKHQFFMSQAVFPQ
jgi:D-xylose 1-dehydrogenase